MSLSLPALRVTVPRAAQRYVISFHYGSLEQPERTEIPGLPRAARNRALFRLIVARLLEAKVRSRIGRHRIETFLARGKQEDLARLADLAQARKLTPVIDRRYPLGAAAEAIRYVGTRNARGKVVINIP